ncbi:MAG: hypothetical protein AAFV53_42610, partial [Myxococcota bacterium]
MSTSMRTILRFCLVAFGVNALIAAVFWLSGAAFSGLGALVVSVSIMFTPLLGTIAAQRLNGERI